MSANYDNWERLVAAVLKKEQLWQLFHEQSRSPSIRSEASDFSSSFDFDSPIHDFDSDFSSDFRSSSSSMLDSPIHPLYFDRSHPVNSSRSWIVLPKLVRISIFSPHFYLKNVRLASSELIGRGNFGSTYIVGMDNMVRVVVKRLKPMITSELDFKRHMDFVGNVTHENVTRLRAYYSSEDVRLVLYDYYSRGSVYALLHGQIGENRVHVDWKTRLRIAIGAARGIAAIHTQNDGKLFHGNIKASNIFLNPRMYGCVSDLGMTNIIETSFSPTVRCYAPEVKNTQNVSQASDVYSFGILLLELLTRRSPAYSPDCHKGVDLVELVSSVKNRERASKVFDADLLKHAAIREEMIKMLEIGIRCAAKSIKNRPKMSEVVRMLEDISQVKPISRASGELVFFDNCNATFDLEDLFRASAEVLGEGTFGNCYKTTLEDGQTITVKKLRYVDVTVKEFRQHMEVVGRMRHENVAELKAYSFSRESRLVVYDYHEKDSLYASLHGERYSSETPLDWETRLKAAMGAARGIAHIHRQGNGNFVHGNVKSSNIFLNNQGYGLVANGGLAKLVNPIRLLSMQSPGYCDSAATNACSMTKASDVYSFGVVLLELVSGRPSQYTSNDNDGEPFSLVNWVQSIGRDEWTAKVLDAELLRYRDDEEAMLELLQIAMDCVSVVSESRPGMPQVVKMLEEISGVEPSYEQDRFEDSWELGLPTDISRLEDLLKLVLPTIKP